MLVYHGSNLAVEAPRLIEQNRYLDFGPGFYTTSNRDQAVEFSRKVMRREGGGIPTVSVYEVGETSLEADLNVLRFGTADEAWLDFVVENRTGTYSGASYDAVVGPVADDDVFTTVTLYLGGVLTKRQALDSLKVKKLFDQYVWKTRAAIASITFAGAFEAKGSSR